MVNNDNCHTLQLVSQVADIFFFAIHAGVANVTSRPPDLTGILCPQMVTVTCSVENLPRLKWSTSSLELTTNAYVYSGGHESQTPINIESRFPGVMIEIVSVSQSTVDADQFTAVSTLTTNLSVLGGLNVQSVYCGSNEVESGILTVDFTIRG